LRHDAIVVRTVHDVGSAEYTKKLETKIDALTTLVNELVVNQSMHLLQQEFVAFSFQLIISQILA